MKRFLLALTILFSIAHAEPIGIDTSGHVATLVRNIEGGYYGQYQFELMGGKGPYSFELLGIPRGWIKIGNAVNIPNIVQLSNARYFITARITDSTGDMAELRLRVLVNGVNVFIDVLSTVQSSSKAEKKEVKEVVKTTTSTSSPVQATSTSSKETIDDEIASLYQKYPGLTSSTQSTQSASQSTVQTTVVTNTASVKIDSPSGAPSVPRIAPTLIHNSQATYNSARDDKVLSVQQVKQNAIFQRQLNANKAVANLISIIQQLTANVNVAKSDILLLQKLLSETEANYKTCQAKIFDFSNIRTKISNAVQDKQAVITNGKNKINDLTKMKQDLENGRNKLVAERAVIEKENSPNALKLAQLENQLTSCIEMKEERMRELNKVKDQITGTYAQIERVQAEFAEAPAAIEQINAQIPLVDFRILELTRQLSEARAERAKLQTSRQTYRKKIINSQFQISSLRRSIIILQSKIPSMQREINAKNLNCKRIELQLQNFRNQISDISQSFKLLLQEIKVQDGLINDKKDQIANVQAQVASTTHQFATLQAEFVRVEETLKRQYFLCNDATEGVKVAKQNLEAMTLKYNTETAWLKEANINLEKARAQKELADLAVQEIIAASSDALPFSIVPNGQGNTYAGALKGNNPSGSPLGPIVETNKIIPGSAVVVGDLKYYLSSAYGVGVDVAKSSSATTLYPLSTLTLEALTGHSQTGVFNPDGTLITSQNSFGNGPFGGGKIPQSYLSQFSCKSTANIVQGYGKVMGVQAGKIRVQNSAGEMINLHIGSCSNLNSNKQDLVLVPSINVYYKGQVTSSGINLHQVTCLA